MKRLANKVAIITGGTSGIGEAMARLFAQEGGAVVFSGRRQARGTAIEQEIRAAGGEASFFQADATSEKDLLSLVAFTLEKYQTIDILCNNAGGLTTAEFTEIDLQEEFDRLMALNVKSYIRLMQLVIPHMQESGGGAIVNTASIGALQAMPMNVTYSVTKAAVKHLTESTAVRYAPEGIRINAILPGLTHSDMVEKGSDFEKERLPLIPLGRAAEPLEIAKGALFLASDDASFCVGVSLLMDGGMLL